MNVFYTSRDPVKASFSLIKNQKRLGRMISETALLIGSAMRLRGYNCDVFYGSKVWNIPHTWWASDKYENVEYLVNLLYEYGLRWFEMKGNHHKTFERWKSFLESFKRGFFNDLFEEYEIDFYDPPNLTPFKRVRVDVAYDFYLLLKETGEFDE